MCKNKTKDFNIWTAAKLVGVFFRFLLFSYSHCWHFPLSIKSSLTWYTFTLFSLASSPFAFFYIHASVSLTKYILSATKEIISLILILFTPSRGPGHSIYNQKKTLHMLSEVKWRHVSLLHSGLLCYRHAKSTMPCTIFFSLFKMNRCFLFGCWWLIWLYETYVNYLYKYF